MCPCNRKSCNCDILGSYVAKCSQDLENSPSPQPPLNVTMFRGECPNFDFNLASQPNNTHLNQSRAARNLDPLDRLELPSKFGDVLVHWCSNPAFQTFALLISHQHRTNRFFCDFPPKNVPKARHIRPVHRSTSTKSHAPTCCRDPSPVIDYLSRCMRWMFVSRAASARRAPCGRTAVLRSAFTLISVHHCQAT